MESAKQPFLDDSSYEELWESVTETIRSRAGWWSHRELSDPGITLAEMWAVLCDMQSFYLDQIQESHYRGYLKLLGMTPDQGSCSGVWVLFEGVESDCILPEGTKMLADTMVFETASEARLIDNRICGIIRGSEKYRFAEMLRSRKTCIVLRRENILFSFLLEKPLVRGRSFHFFVLVDEKSAQRNPPVQGFSLVSLFWEYRTKDGWREARILADDTFGLLYSGCVHLAIDDTMTAGEDGSYEIRCRVREGEYDKMPVLYYIALNAVWAVQRNTLCRQDFGCFSQPWGRVELKSYLAKTGDVRVLAYRGPGQWEDITLECTVEPPVTAKRQRRFVYCRKQEIARFVCSAEGFTEEYSPCPVTGVTSQQISIPWKTVKRDSVGLMLAGDENGNYRDYRMADPEEVRYANAWHWCDGEDAIVLGDGRHGDIPPASDRGLLLTSLALFEGQRGNISIGRISRLERPELFPGITCSNPLEGRGGRQRKTPSEQFQDAEKLLRQPGRIVTEEDAADLAARIPGLLARRAAARWQDNTIVITLPGTPLNSEYCKNKYQRMAEEYLEQYRPAGVRIRVEISKGE